MARGDRDVASNLYERSNFLGVNARGTCAWPRVGRRVCCRQREKKGTFEKGHESARGPLRGRRKPPIRPANRTKTGLTDAETKEKQHGTKKEDSPPFTHYIYTYLRAEGLKNDKEKRVENRINL